MKRFVSILLILLLCLSLCAALSGCANRPTVGVSSVLEIDENFAGTRTVSVIYPLSVKIDSIKDVLTGHAPTSKIEGASFDYIGVEDDGYYFELKMSFDSKEMYEKELSVLLGRSSSVFLSRKHTYLTKGTRMSEDFEVSELISWVVRDTLGNKKTKNLMFDYSSNVVTIGEDSFSTDSKTEINDCSGSTVKEISIITSNGKNDLYDRTFTFTVPNTTYSKDVSGIKAYFLTNTMPASQEQDYWSTEGSNMVYTVVYKELSISQLRQATAMLLDTDSVEISYGDINNASTPLAQGYTFEESLDTFSFIGPNKGYVPLNYSYSLPLDTTYGEGSVFENGRWIGAGEWTDDLYTVKLKNGSVKLHIPDGKQYSVEGIDFTIESLGDSRFRRTTDFKYSKTDGAEGLDYAMSYFKAKKIASEKITEDNCLVCRVSFEGTTDEITAQLKSAFGSGNFMEYEKRKGTFDLSVKTVLTDYINIGYMLNSENINCPMTYTVSSKGGDNFVSVAVDGSETAYTEHGSKTLNIKNGIATISCHGNIPVLSSILIYIFVGLILLTLTTFIAVKLIRPKKGSVDRGAYADDTFDYEGTDDESDGKKPSLKQTTTFSIFELNTLIRNKKYVDEINKDVEERIHAQSLEEQKNDIRSRELEEMSRKVYGSGEEDDGFVHVPAVEAHGDDVDDYAEVPEVEEDHEETDGFLNVPGVGEEPGEEEAPEEVELPKTPEQQEDDTQAYGEDDEEEDGERWYD